uniref:DUF7448 domain-containing protein n=2 Tax=viral metagenome TaxID=1070528 RepID=A0A6H2A0S2_9ZZZZ
MINIEFRELVGKTLSTVMCEIGNDEILFETISGDRYKLYHEQDCCENVNVEDIIGDLEDLIGSPLLMAEEVSHRDENPEGIDVPGGQESFTWTFYKLATIRGSVTIRWYGKSNGCYSESVNFARIK